MFYKLFKFYANKYLAEQMAYNIKRQFSVYNIKMNFYITKKGLEAYYNFAGTNELKEDRLLISIKYEDIMPNLNNSDFYKNIKEIYQKQVEKIW